MAFFVARRLLYLVPVLIAVSLLTFSIASLLPGDLAYTILGDQATPEDLAALLHMARPRVAGRLRPLLPHWPDGAAGGGRAVARIDRTDVAGAAWRARDRRAARDRLCCAQRRPVRPLHDRHGLRHAVGA